MKNVFEMQALLRKLTSQETNIKTIEVHRAYLMIEQVLAFGTTGALIYGRPRLGKTRAIKIITADLAKTFPDMPVFCKYSIKHVPNEKQFYSEMLTVVGLAAKRTMTGHEMRILLKDAMIAAAEHTKFRRICLFIDEAQMLNLVDYTCLIDLYNLLDHEDIQLSVFLVGQPELVKQKEAFKIAHQDQIIGRFMMREAEFSGIRSSESLAHVLNEIDTADNLRGDASSLTELLYGDSAVNGETLASIADDLYEAFLEQNRLAGIRHNDIGMKYIIETLAYLFAQYSDLGLHPAGFPDKDLLLRCVQSIGYGV